MSKILKFGGTSVGTPERIAHVLGIVSARAREDHIVVVVSAFTGVTNELIEVSKLAANSQAEWKIRFSALCERHLDAVRELITPKDQSGVLVALKLMLNELEDTLQGVSLVKEISTRTLDTVLSFGERLCAYICTESVKARGDDAEFLDTRQVIRSDANFGNARVNLIESNRKIREYFAEHPRLQIATGFIAATSTKETTTLGRGGSDYTASILGAALNASVIEIWTDVDGMYTADPRKVTRAFPLPEVSYEEALELCHFGAKVIYPPTLQPALDNCIPILIKNTFNPTAAGTVIKENPSPHHYAITGISSISQVAVVQVQGSGLIGVTGTAMRVFDALSRAGVNVILITQASSEHSICLAVDPSQAGAACLALDNEFKLEQQAGLVDPTRADYDASVISVVGENMRNSPGLAGRVFYALGRNGINVIAIAQGSSELNISAVIRRSDEVKALNAIHDAFFLSGQRSLNIFVAGCGLIGKALLRQIGAQSSVLRQRLGLDIRLVGLANTSRSLFAATGLEPNQAIESLASAPPQTSLESFIVSIKKLNLPSSVFVDCSASDDVVSYYEQILDASIPIVTPNKRAQAGPLGSFSHLKQLAHKRGVEFLYEASVGAGLPVIGTLNDLLKSGDSIKRIEAVLSGTLSFIFNSFSASRSFSEVVKEARTRGYTEPDPRDDLNGLDAARKILILARECGMQLELSDVKIEQLLDEEYLAIPTVEEFMARLPELDQKFGLRAEAANRDSKRLRFIARLEGGQAQLSLEAVGQDHPFYSLSGNDNVISFTTARYAERPLVVRGPGAGAEVTAAAVFADIIRLAQTYPG